jgi:hypothetical protein
LPGLWRFCALQPAICRATISQAIAPCKATAIILS